MFINLTARKANGDFYITSSEVEMEKYPQLNNQTVREWMVDKANYYFSNGWNIELKQVEL